MAFAAPHYPKFLLLPSSLGLPMGDVVPYVKAIFANLDTHSIGFTTEDVSLVEDEIWFADIHSSCRCTFPGVRVIVVRQMLGAVPLLRRMQVSFRRRESGSNDAEIGTRGQMRPLD